jgi:hypothetical protein
MFITFITGSGLEMFVNTHYQRALMFLVQLIFKLFAVGAQGIYPQGLAFNGDGTEMFVAHSGQ